MANTPTSERILAIVNLIVHYLTDDDGKWDGEREIVEELMDVGFAAEEIEAAFDWMTRLSRQVPENEAGFAALTTQRVFTDDERRILGTEAIDFLLRLRRLGLVDEKLHEEIVEKALEAGRDGLALEDLKVIAALLALSRTRQDLQREFSCLMDDDWTRLFH